MRRFPSPSRSSTGARSHSLMSHSTCRSTTRRATAFSSSACGIASKYFDRSASTTLDYPHHPSNVLCPIPRQIEQVHVSIASLSARPSPFPRRVGIRIFTFEMLWGGRWRDVTIVAGSNAMERPMAQQLDDLSRSLTPLEQDSTIIAVIEMSQASWLVAGVVPGIERHPLKKLEPSEGDLLRLFMRWRAEATEKGRTITRIAVAFEAGRDGFWVARRVPGRGIGGYLIPPPGGAGSRGRRPPETKPL